jgi:hypothetical protein
MERQGQITISSSYRPLDFMHVVQHGTGLICSRVLDLTLRLFVRRHTIVTAIVTVTATATAARGLLLELCDAKIAISISAHPLQTQRIQSSTPS